nr:helix-turn-helix domain-containing protein [Sphingomonas colocasiae]
MLLCLFIAAERGRILTISEVAKSIDVPLNTALRYAEDLEARGLLRRARDTRDARRTLLYLSPEADEKMRAFLRRAEPMPPASP